MNFVFKFVPAETHVFIHIPKNGEAALWKTWGEYEKGVVDFCKYKFGE